MKLCIRFGHPYRKVASSPEKSGLPLGACPDWPKEAPCLMEIFPYLKRRGTQRGRCIYKRCGLAGKIFQKTAKCSKVSTKASLIKRLESSFSRGRKVIEQEGRLHQFVGKLARGLSPPLQASGRSMTRKLLPSMNSTLQDKSTEFFRTYILALCFVITYVTVEVERDRLKFCWGGFQGWTSAGDARLSWVVPSWKYRVFIDWIIMPSMIRIDRNALLQSGKSTTSSRLADAATLALQESSAIKISKFRLGFITTPLR